MENKVHDPVFSWRNQEIVNQVFADMDACKEIVIYDFETSGLSPEKDQPIEAAAVRLAFSGGEWIEKAALQQYIRLPDGQKLDEEVAQLTGITQEVLDNAPLEQECFESIRLFFENSAVAGYNNRYFDDKFMEHMYRRNGRAFLPKRRLDVWEMVRDFIPADEVPNFKLETIATHLGLSDIQFHSALDDTRATAALFRYFYTLYKTGKTRYFKGEERPRIQQIAYWADHGLERIYVNNDLAKIYYDLQRRRWMSSSNKIDLPWLEQQVWKLMGAHCLDEFERFRDKVRVDEF